MEHHLGPLIAIVWAVGAGLLGQVLAHRWQVPSIVLLLFLGIALGPDGLDWVRPAELGDGLAILIKLAVSIILFEGALNLRLGDLKRTAGPVRNLVTIGVLVTWILTSLLAHFVAHLSWPVALTFGSLMTVTGPTVVHPLLKRIHVPRKIKAILEGEAILTDPIGAILAVSVLDLVMGMRDRSAGLETAVWGYGGRILVGAAVGVVGGILLTLLMRARRFVPAELANLVALAGVWVTFGIAESLQSEAGLMSSVVLGLVLQRGAVPGERQLRRFKENLTVLSISVLFILLAANLRLEAVASEGLRGVATVLMMMLVVRPISVFLSTRGADLSGRERAFISWIGPRGIVAASVASLFALTMAEDGYAGGERLLALTFLAVAMTVTIQGLTAPLLARALGIHSMERRRAVVVGAGPLGRSIAGILKANQRPVVLIDRNPVFVEEARRAGFDVVLGNALDEDTLDQARTDEAETLVGVTSNSEVNVLAAQLARDLFGVGRAYPALDSPERGAGPRLLKSSGGNLAFGRPIDVAHWDRLADEHMRTEEWQVPAAWRATEAAGVPCPLDALPLVRLRDSSADVVHADQIWQRGDRVIFLCPPGSPPVAAAMEAIQAEAASKGER